MRKTKRGGDHLTRSLCKSRRASKNESLVSGRFLGDSDQGVSSGLTDRPISYLCKNVASITLYNGDTILFSCSGIAMERQGCHLTRFLTSASLVRALNGTNKDHDDLKRFTGTSIDVYMPFCSPIQSTLALFIKELIMFGARPIGEKSNSHPEVHGDFLNQELLDLDSMGYPKLPSSMLGAGMILVNTFEETFGDIHGEGV
uniref:Uncharacterized protein n=1 Tax=Avena sativa TaxID=4498 RepID=A0ACD5UZM8_AVESA